MSESKKIVYLKLTAVIKGFPDGFVSGTETVNAILESAIKELEEFKIDKGMLSGSFEIIEVQEEK